MGVNGLSLKSKNERNHKKICGEYLTLKKMNNLICYCFGYTEDNIKEDFLKNGQSLIQKKIQSEKKFGSCECATKHPKGK